MTQMNLSMKQKLTHRHREQTCGCQGGGGQVLKSGTSRYKLLYIGWINNKVLVYSTGNYIQYLVINHNGKNIKQSSLCSTVGPCWLSIFNTAARICHF